MYSAVPVSYSFSTAGGGGSDMEAADIDNDLDIDLVTTGSGSTGTILINDGSGVFMQTAFDHGYQSRDVEIGDINKDGYLDLVFANSNFSSQGFLVLFGDGSGSYINDPLNSTNIFTGYPMFSLELRDMSGNGFLDYVGGTDGIYTDLAMVVRSDTGTIEQLSTTSWSSHHIIRVADVNNDLSYDVLVEGGLFVDLAANPPIADREIMVYEQTNPHQCGDANSHEILNVADALYMLEMLFPSSTPYPQITSDALLDVNNDGKFNLADVTSSLIYLFPPSPGANDDMLQCTLP